jgi:hypothetical protein
MSVSFQDLQEAIYLDDRDEFLIWQNSSQRNKRVKRGNLFASKGLTVRGKFIDVESGNDVGLAAATAINDAAVAQATANGAQTSANGKNKIFYQTTAPTSGAGGTSGYALIENDLWFDTDGGYRMAKWNGSSWVDYGLETEAIANLDAGKIIAGFIGAQVININGSSGGGASGTSGAAGYIESTNFVPSWVSGALTVRQYTTSGTSGAYLGKHIPSDTVQVKVLQGDGKYKLFRSLQDQGENATNAPPSSGNNDYWQEITGASIPVFEIEIPGGGTKQIQNFGFRIVSNGYAEFGGSLFRGAVVANEGFFGTTSNAVRLDDDGLTVGDYGRLKSASLGYSGTSFFVTSGTSGGFFLGNTQAEGAQALYQLYIGSPATNNLWWNGTNLLINGSLGAFARGTSGTSGFGLTIGSGFGIRYINNDAVLTITGGQTNGVPSGAQIDLVGSNYLNGTGGKAGLLLLQAGSGDGSGIVLSTNVSTDPSGLVGAQRLTISNTGLVTVEKQQVTGPTYTSGAGNLYVQSNLGVGRTPDPQNGSGDSIGKVWASEEVTVYNGAIRSAILKKTDGAGMGFFRNGADAVTITLDGRTGDISASSYNSTSSKRFKKKIRKLKDGLSIINSLRPVTFDWKKKDKKDEIGLIAEEVYEVLPSIVKLDEENLPSAIDYSKLTPILIQAVKELFSEVERLKDKIK